MTTGANWLTGWGYRKSHLITHAAGTGTNYQVMIKVYKTTGTDGNETIGDISAGKVYVGTNCLDNFADVRFTDDTGNGSLDFYLDPDNLVSGTSAIFWVEVSADLTSVDKTIYIYYKKDDATSASSGTNTFLCFADGNSANQWTVVDPKNSVTWDATNNYIKFTNISRDATNVCVIYKTITLPAYFRTYWKRHAISGDANHSHREMIYGRLGAKWVSQTYAWGFDAEGDANVPPYQYLVKVVNGSFTYDSYIQNALGTTWWCQTVVSGSPTLNQVHKEYSNASRVTQSGSTLTYDVTTANNACTNFCLMCTTGDVNPDTSRIGTLWIGGVMVMAYSPTEPTHGSSTSWGEEEEGGAVPVAYEKTITAKLGGIGVFSRTILHHFTKTISEIVGGIGNFSVNRWTNHLKTLTQKLGLKIGKPYLYDSRVLYLPLDEGSGTTAIDAEGLSNGTINNASYVSGKYGTALQFNGTDSLVQMDDVLNPKTDSFTVSFWVKTTASGSIQTLVYKADYPDTDCRGFIIRKQSTGEVLALIGNGTNEVNGTSTTKINDGAWHFVAVVFDRSGNLSIHIDGGAAEGVASITAYSGVNIENTIPLTIGSYDYGNIYFNGYLDDVQFFSRALTEEEIRTIYGPITPSGCVFHLPMNENAGVVTYDTISNLNCDITNATWATGKHGSALNFTNDSTVDVPSTTTVNVQNDFSITALIKVDDNSGFRSILCGNNPLSIFFFVHDGHLGMYTSHDGGNWDIIWNTSASIENDTWYHVAATYDSVLAHVKLYINGVYESIGFGTGDTGTTGELNNPAGFDIGSWTNSSYFFDGIIDDVHIFNRMLKDQEILALYNKIYSCELYLPLDEGTGTVAYDHSGNNLTGSIVNATWADGKYGKSLEFDGVYDNDDKCKVPMDMSIPFTVSGWMFLTTNGTWLIATKGDWAVTGSWYIYNDHDTAITFVLFYDGINSYGVGTGTIPSLQNAWHHVVAVCEYGQRMKLYLDGKADSGNGDVVATNPTLVTDDLLIGGFATAGYNFKGNIDEFKIFSRALSPTEVAALYKSSLYEKVKSMVRVKTGKVGLINTFSTIKAIFREFAQQIVGLIGSISYKTKTINRTFAEIVGTIDSYSVAFKKVKILLSKVGLIDSETHTLVLGTFRWTWKEHPRIKVTKEDEEG